MSDNDGVLGIISGGREYLRYEVTDTNSRNNTYNNIVYISFSDEESRMINIEVNVSKKTSYLYEDKNVDIIQYSEMDEFNMIFDKLIGNPPYGGQKKGSSNFYIKVLEKVVPLSKESIILCPKTWTSSFAWADKFINTKKRIVNSVDVNPNEFGADFASEVSIYYFRNDEESNYYKTLLFKDFTNPELTSFIYEYFRTLPQMSDKFISFKKKITKKQENEKNETIRVSVINPKSDKYYVGIPEVRGHRNQDTSEVIWDFYTYCSNDDTVMKGSVKENWMCGKEFDSLEEAQKFRDYLDSDIAMFALSIVKKNNNIQCSLPYVPYMTTIEETATAVSKISSYTKEQVIEYITNEMKDFGWKTRKIDKK